jgi:hypothetical protein
MNRCTYCQTKFCTATDRGHTDFILIIVPFDEKSKKAVPLHAMEALGGRGGIAPTHSRPRH